MIAAITSLASSSLQLVCTYLLKDTSFPKLLSRRFLSPDDTGSRGEYQIHPFVAFTTPTASSGSMFLRSDLLPAARVDADPNGWKNAVLLYPRSFQDTNGDGIGDLDGIYHRLEETWRASGVDIIWISPSIARQADNYDISDCRDIDPCLAAGCL